MTKIVDKNDKVVKDGDLLKFDNTVNGCNMFVILDVEKRDIRYFDDTSTLEYKLGREYEYDVADLLCLPSTHPDWGWITEIDFKVIGSVYDGHYKIPNLVLKKNLEELIK